MKKLFLAALAIVAGLSAGCGKSQDLGDAQKRVVHVVVEKVNWNYIPGDTDPVAGDIQTAFTDIPENVQPLVDRYTAQAAFNPADPEATRIGRTYRKYVFFPATSDGTKKDKDDALGILGPVIRAQEGDTIELHVHHPAGLTFEVEIEGLTPDTEATDPGVTEDVYKWTVSSAPLEELDPENNPSRALVYRAKTADMENAGLIGPVVIYAKGLLNTGNNPSVRGIDKEHFALFKMFDENKSALSDENILGTGATEADIPAVTAGVDFQKSNLRYSVNGRQFGTGEKIVINRKQRNIWYVIGGTYTGNDAEPPFGLPAAGAGWSYQPTWSGDSETRTLHPGGGVSHIVARSSSLGDHLLFPDLDLNPGEPQPFVNRGMFAFYEIKDN